MNDDELLARLRAADPARTSSAPAPDINRLVEAAMNTDAASRPSTTDAPAPVTKLAPTRRRLLGLSAAAGLLLAGGIVTGILSSGGGSSTAPVAAPPPVKLTATAGTGAKCAEPTPERMREYPVLFAGTVTSVEGQVVTFHIDLWLTGSGSDTAMLDTGVPNSETTTFLAGEHYIVAATEDGQIPTCAVNAADAATIARFRQAYGK
ncbi:hypothetical protein J5X84_26655 [Streptosporangiaceae bacterium NEAU-GS5]|nr:hypothetical protein [Streptosporangiaceae bacterium NEAU-GS5]